jgi:polyhydroxyalkanoate synthase subunit PhaC
MVFERLAPSLYFALAALVLLFATLAHQVFWRWRLSFAVHYCLVESFSTPDGSRFELRRLTPPVAAVSPTPILLVHGVACNHRNQDAHPDNSLARHLSALGRDVWLLTLRSGLHLGFRQRCRTCFEAMAKYDVPMAVRTVLQRAGASSLDYVGFSMGGMLLYACLDRGVPQSSIRSAVLVGAPGRISAPVRVPRWLGSIPRWLIPTLPLRFLALAFAFVAEALPALVHRPILNPRNMSRRMTRLAMANCIEDVPGRLHADFIGWASRGGGIYAGGQPILEGLSLSRVPALFVAGSDDRIAPPDTVRDAFEAWGSACPSVRKRILVLGRDHGTNDDYGHGDLAMGAQLARELFLPVAEFIKVECQP